MKYFEVGFDITYLLSVILFSILIILKGISRNRDKAIIIFGFMGLLLGFGDSFHLIPRIIAHLTTGLNNYSFALGIGKLITGITMTIFYYLIYRFYTIKTGRNSNKLHLTILSLIAIRFFMLALPGNGWQLNGNTLFYGILRNIPFTILGILIVYLFFKTKLVLFRKFGIWIVVSFACYVIVVLGSGSIPELGAFMMPKTVAYFMIIYTEYRELTSKKHRYT